MKVLYFLKKSYDLDMVITLLDYVVVTGQNCKKVALYIIAM